MKSEKYEPIQGSKFCSEAFVPKLVKRHKEFKLFPLLVHILIPTHPNHINPN